MEKTIDRKEYRRNNEKEKRIDDEQINVLQRKIKKVLFQTLGVSILLLIISFLKFYNCESILNEIDYALNTEITISSLQKNGQRIFNEANEYYTKLNTLVEKMLIDSNVVNKNNDSKINNSFLESGEVMDSNLNYINQTLNSGENLLYNNITNVSGNIYESAVEGINQMSEDARYIKENYNFIVPVIGTITSQFGVRNSTNPIVSHYHSGLDIAANTGTQILAAIDGEVIEATTDTYFGKYLKIKKDDMVMTYAHCSKLLVKVGEKVQKGKLIAYVGNTGNSTGPHLHFELKYQDRLVDPLNVLDI